MPRGGEAGRGTASAPGPRSTRASELRRPPAAAGARGSCGGRRGGAPSRLARRSPVALLNSTRCASSERPYPVEEAVRERDVLLVAHDAAAVVVDARVGQPGGEHAVVGGDVLGSHGAA